VLYRDIHALLDRFIRTNKDVKYLQFTHFSEIKEIGSGGYGTVYIAKYTNSLSLETHTRVLKRFKNFDEMSELFISEVSNNWWY